MFTNQYYQLLELLQKRKIKGAIMVERLDKGSSIELRNMTVTNMQSK